jgi:hypothetical protein
MPIESGMKYDATVLSAKMTESRGLKPGIWVNFAILDGSGKSLGTLSKTIWLTPTNRENARKELKTLGATDEQVTTKAGFQKLISDLNAYLDAECSVTTEEETYEGRKTMKIKWINRRVQPASQAAIDIAESLFDDGGEGMGRAMDSHEGDPGPGDDHVPY